MHTVPFWRMTHNVDPYVRQAIRRGGKASEVFPLDQIPDLGNYKQDSLGLFRQQAGHYPMVVTVDTEALASVVHQRDYTNARRDILYNLSQASMQYPLFNIIEIGDQDFGESETASVTRKESGRYSCRPDNMHDIKGLLIKVGVDYALTKQVRGLSTLVSAL